MTQKPDFGLALKNWGKIGVLSFGGPAAQIALMHRIIVDENKWLSEKQFLNALNFCMLLPGPEAMQLATYAGWRMHGVLGGLAAGTLFVLPGAAVILLLAALYTAYGAVGLVAAAFLGIKAAVLIIVFEALLKVARRALHGISHYCVAAASFIGLFFLSVPYPFIVLIAAIFGVFAFAKEEAEPEPKVENPRALRRLMVTVLVGLAVWWLPVALLWAANAPEILTQIAVFFSKLAVVTFGGAYAVLAYMAQDVVEAKSWLSASEMIDGLGLAETTPGPLILVTEFVGFLAAEKAGGFWLGVAGAATTLWVTFIPCFLWIFAGAPFIDRISANARLAGALSAITAAVVGVILNLSIWFGLNVLFGELTTIETGLLQTLVPDLSTIDLRVLVIAMLAGLLLLKLKWNVVATLFICAIAGIAVSAINL